MLARFASSYYTGEAALTEHTYGKGRVLHLGGTFTVENTRRILAHLKLLEPLKAYVDAPEAVEIVVRKKGENRWLFVLNYNSLPVEVQLKKPFVSLLDDNTDEGAYTLPPYGVQVWKAD